MASETVQKILDAEAESEKKRIEANERKEQLINEANGRSYETIQKRISDAVKETDKLKADYKHKLSEYVKEADKKCVTQLAELRTLSEKNMGNAVDAVIRNYF